MWRYDKETDRYYHVVHTDVYLMASDPDTFWLIENATWPVKLNRGNLYSAMDEARIKLIEIRGTG